MAYYAYKIAWKGKIKRNEESMVGYNKQHKNDGKQQRVVYNRHLE